MDIPLPQSHERRLRCSGPIAKGNLLLSALPERCRAFLSGLAESRQAARGGSFAGSHTALGLPGLQAELVGMRAGAVAQVFPFFLSTGTACIAV